MHEGQRGGCYNGERRERAWSGGERERGGLSHTRLAREQPDFASSGRMSEGSGTVSRAWTAGSDPAPAQTGCGGHGPGLLPPLDFSFPFGMGEIDECGGHEDEHPMS